MACRSRAASILVCRAAWEGDLQGGQKLLREVAIHRCLERNDGVVSDGFPDPIAGIAESQVDHRDSKWRQVDRAIAQERVAQARSGFESTISSRTLPTTSAIPIRFIERCFMTTNYRSISSISRSR